VSPPHPSLLTAPTGMARDRPRHTP
jgi:hypothetical protein